MKKYIQALLFFLLLLVSSSLKGHHADSLKIDSSNFSLSIQNQDSVFTYIPKLWDLRPENDSTTLGNKSIRSNLRSAASENMDLSHIPSSYTVDKTKDIGEITISQGSGQGSLTYNIPIEAYSAGGNLKPSIELIYNSLSGSGVAGYGWQLSGALAISPANMTIYYDGATNPIRLYGRNYGRYTLNGSRLITLNTGNANIENYQTESGSIKVTAYLNGDVIKYFTAASPDGTVSTYGFESNTSQKLTYPLTKVVDSQGNLITYNYIEKNNIYYLSEINYGARNGTTYPNYGQIKFNYEIRPDIDITYVAGAEVKQDQRLKNITTYFNSQLLRTYTLTYEFTTASLLKKIDCSSSGKMLNPLIFYYGENNVVTKFEKYSTILSSYFSNASAPSLILSKGKFDTSSINDGMISYPAKSIYGLLETKKNILGQITGSRYGSTYASDQSLLVYSDLASGISTPSKLTAESGFLQLIPLDVDGDGNDELVKMNSSIINSGTERITFKVYNISSSLGSTYANMKYTFTADFGGVVDLGGLYSPQNRTYLTGDFLGTGKQSVLCLSYCKNLKGEKINSWATLVDIDAKTKSSLYDKPCFDLDFEDNVFAIDFDGDGRTDIVHMNSKGTTIYSFIESGYLYSVADYKGLVGTAYTKTPGGTRSVVVAGDVNGDGKTDLLVGPPQIYRQSGYYARCGECDMCMGYGTCYQGDLCCQRPVYIDGPLVKTGNKWDLYISGGASYNPFIKTSINLVENNGGSTFMLQDMNGDGKADFIASEKLYVDDIAKATISVYLSENGTLKTKPESQTLVINGDAYLIPGNISQSYKMSQLFSIYNSELTPIVFSRDEGKQRLLTGMVSSSGIITKHTYGNIQISGGVYAKGTLATFPCRNLMGNLSLYAGSDAYLNNARIAASSINYTRGLVHLQGRGFLGFEKIVTNDNLRGIATTQTFDPLNFGVLKSSDSPVSSATYNYTVSIAANKIATVTLANKTEKDKLKDVSISSTYTYDTYGNPTKQVADYGGGIKITTDNLYNNFTGTPYKLGELNTQTVTHERGGTSIATKTLITYTSKGLPETKKDYFSNNLTLEESYVYDSNGNLSESKSKAYASVNWLITKFTYDSFGRVSRKTDPLGLYIDYGYNTKGLLSSEKNHKALETKYEYDSWERKIKTTYADGVIESSTLAWATSPVGALIVSTTTTTGSPTTQVYMDALGREVRKGVMRFDGKYMYTDNVYDSKGRLEKSSLPFKAAATLWNTYAYDTYDRLTSLTYASGKKGSYAYDKNKVTQTIDNIAKTTTYDATGQEINIVDPAGTITYNYRPDGQPSSIVAPGSVTTSFEYDAYGRQTKLIDPSAGTKVFTFDTAGNLNQETDARGKVIKTTYDTYNRVKTKEVVGELTTTYAYNADGQIASETGSNATAKSFTYDNLMRLSTEKENVVDGKWLQKTYTYASGTVASLAYTSNLGSIATENNVYTNGHLTEIKLNNVTSIWKLTAENDLGLPTTATTGALTRTYGYDAYGLPTARSAKNATVTLQNFGYSFNAQTGNLTWRKDVNRNIQENFTYDNLNRLTTFSGKTITYDVKGNITNYTTVGQFAYTLAGKPYMVNEITPYGTEIAQRLQTITYNGMMRPATIAENNYTASFVYNTDGDRVKMLLKKGTADELIRYYIGGQYESDAGIAGTKERLYLGGDAYSAAAVYVKEGTGAWTVNYICRDYLGSITHVTDAAGNLRQELSYDPWGRLRNPVNQALYAVDVEPVLLFGRGYTGHEHLAMFGLINMNARLYDPVVGRFLSPDPYVQSIGLSQNFNRYSYALNNPLRYTDASGELWQFVAGAILGGTINVVVNLNNIGSFSQGLSYFVVGAGGGMLMATGNPLAIVAGGALMAGGNSALTQGYQNGFNNINWNQVGSASILGGGLAYAGYGIGSYFNSVFTPMFSSVGGPAIQQGLAYGASGAATGFTMGTGMSLIGGQSLGDALKNGGYSAALGFGVGFAGGFYKGFQDARRLNVNPLTNKSTNPVSSNSNQSLQYSNKQIGKKFGEHMDQNKVGYRNPKEYIELANDIYNNPNSTKIVYPTGSPLYQGETHYIHNGNLLRLDNTGNFRSLYPTNP